MTSEIPVMITQSLIPVTHWLSCGFGETLPSLFEGELLFSMFCAELRFPFSSFSISSLSATKELRLDDDMMECWALSETVL